MLIHTPSAVLKVIGTQFDVEADPKSTLLYVREGKVEACRVHDDRKVDVSANHRVAVATDSDMVPRFVGPDRTWAQTPAWQNIATTGDQNSIATQEARDYDGTRNLLLSESPEILPAQDTGYTIRGGDVYEIRYEWLDDTWWTAQDQVAIKLFTTDNDLISGTPTTFATVFSGTLTTAGTYEAASGSAKATATASQEETFRRDRHTRRRWRARRRRSIRQLPLAGDALPRARAASPGRLSIAGDTLSRPSAPTYRRDYHRGTCP